MPSFRQEVNVDEWVDVDVDIDVREFFDEMSETEKDEMRRLLGDETLENESSRSSWEFDEAILKLKKNYYGLTNEETNLIIKLAKRF